MIRPINLLLFICFAVCVAIGCGTAPCEPEPSYQYGPPVDAPTLDYESISGLDPQTVQLVEERERIDNLTWRIERLERQVSDLSAIVHPTGQSGLGDAPPTIDFEPEPLLE